jgi:ribonuclease HI
VRRERLLLDPAVRADRRRILGLLHADFVEFGMSGRIWDAQATAEALAKQHDPGGHHIVDLVPTSLSGDAVLLTYRVDTPQGSSLRSSVWLRDDDGEWLLRFHQGTATTPRA